MIPNTKSPSHPVAKSTVTRHLPAHEQAARSARRQREKPAATTVPSAPHPKPSVRPADNRPSAAAQPRADWRAKTFV